MRSSSPAPSPPPNPQPISQPSTSTSGPRRFISSILGGDAPYGSRRHILTRAELKEYSSPPIASDGPPQFVSKSEKITLPRPKTPQKTPHVEPPTRASVIQRVPPKNKSTSRKEEKIEIDRIEQVLDPEPEQVNRLITLKLLFSESPFLRFNGRICQNDALCLESSCLYPLVDSVGCFF